MPGNLIKTIVWDIDDVLNDLTRSWFRLGWLQEDPGCTLGYEDLTENPPHKLLGTALSTYLTSLDRFRVSPEAEGMKPNAVALAWFQQWGENFRHLALTARPIKTVWPAVKWLLHHFGEWFQTISFVPSRRRDEHPRQPDQDKAAVLAWLGRVDYFIDDNAVNVRKAANLGVCSFLVSQPWNDSPLTLSDILKIINMKSHLR